MTIRVLHTGYTRTDLIKILEATWVMLRRREIIATWFRADGKELQEGKRF